MNQKKSKGKKIRIYDVAEYFFAFLLILQFRSIYIYCDEFKWATGRSLAIAIVLMVLICCASKRRIQVGKLKNLVKFAILATAFIGFHFVIRHYALEQTLRFLILTISVATYHYLCGNEEYRYALLYKYENLIVIIAGISLFFWIFGSNLGAFHPSSTVYSSWTSTGTNTVKAVSNYHGVYFETQIVRFVGLFRIVRNTAIFTEGPMCSFHFALALMIELFLRQRTNVKKVVFLSVAVVTNFTTTGIIIGLLAIAIKIFMDNRKRSIWGYIRILIFPAIIIGVIVTVEYLIQSRIGTRSGSTRIDDLVAGYKAWKESPLFGHGYGNDGSYQKYMSSFRIDNDGFSNSIMLILSYGGVYLLLPYLYAGVKSIRNGLKQKDYKNIVFMLLYVLMLAVTVAPFQALTIYLFILFNAYATQLVFSQKINRGRD